MSSKLTPNRRGGLRDFPCGGYHESSLLIPLELHDPSARGGTLFDGRDGAPLDGDVAIAGDTIAAIGDLHDWRGRDELDAAGLAVAPGFVNPGPARRRILKRCLGRRSSRWQSCSRR